MVALHYLKYTHDLSNGAVLRGRVENPCWQYLSGMKYFSHEMPVDASSMSRWRRLIGEAGAEELLKETIRAGLRLRIIKPSQLKRVNVDTTVQEKYIRFPTDARLYDHRAQTVLRTGRKEVAHPAEPLRRSSAVQAGVALHAQAAHHPLAGSAAT
jgi:IS5 family transposase